MKKLTIKSMLLIALLNASTTMPLYKTPQTMVSQTETQYTATKKEFIKPSVIYPKQTTIGWLRTEITQAKNTVWGEYSFKKHYLRRLLLLASATMGGIALYLQKSEHAAAPAPIIPPPPAPAPAPAPAGPAPFVPPLVLPRPIPHPLPPRTFAANIRKCQACTYWNNSNALHCEICESSLPYLDNNDEKGDEDEKEQQELFITCPHCTLDNQVDSISCVMCNSSLDPSNPLFNQAHPGAAMPFPILENFSDEDFSEEIIICNNCLVPNKATNKKCTSCNLNPQNLKPAQAPSLKSINISAMIKRAITNNMSCMLPWLCDNYPNDIQGLSCPICAEEITELITKKTKLSPVSNRCDDIMCVDCKDLFDGNEDAKKKCPLCRMSCEDDPLAEASANVFYQGQSEKAYQEALAKLALMRNQLENAEQQQENRDLDFEFLRNEFRTTTKQCCDDPDNCVHARP